MHRHSLISASPTIPSLPPALVIGHPGHELLVHGWLQQARPQVFVLTDGSGRTGQSRLDSTTKILEQGGAGPGSIYGRFTDQAIYTAILNQDLNLFIGLAQELAETFIRDQIGYVVGDAAESFNPTHDLCRLIINAAVRIVNRQSGKLITNFDFLLAGRPDTRPEALQAQAIRLQLDEKAFHLKLAAARNYPEMAREVDAALSTVGADAFRFECLRPVDQCAGNGHLYGERPYYEQYGEQQITAGYYQRVIRYQEHMAPIAQSLSEYVSEVQARE